MLGCMCAVRRSPVAGLAFVATGVYSTVIYTLDAFPSITFPATQKYDTQSDLWVCTTRIPTLRMTESSSYGAFAAALGDKIHVIAGGDISETKTKNEVYSPVTDSWTSKVSVPTEYNGGFVGVWDSIVVVGGGISMHKYAQRMDAWTTGMRLSFPAVVSCRFPGLFSRALCSQTAAELDIGLAIRLGQARRALRCWRPRTADERVLRHARGVHRPDGHVDDRCATLMCAPCDWLTDGPVGCRGRLADANGAQLRLLGYRRRRPLLLGRRIRADNGKGCVREDRRRHARADVDSDAVADRYADPLADVEPQPLADSVPDSEAVGDNRAPELCAHPRSNTRNRLSAGAIASRVAGSCE